MPNKFRLATFNCENLFARDDNPEASDRCSLYEDISFP